MIRIIIVLLFTVLPVSAERMPDNVAHVVFSSDNSVRISDLPSITPEVFALVRDSIEFNSKAIPYVDSARWAKWKPSEFSSVRRFDYSGDGAPDLILDGLIAAEQNITYLWLHHDSTYEFHYCLKGEAIRFLRESVFDPYSIVIEEGLCCDGYIGEYTLLEPIWYADRIKYISRLVIKQFRDTQIPITRTMSKHFRLSNAECLLRTEPVITNDYDCYWSDFEEMEVCGNIIARFTQPGNGIAFAEERDSLGGLWYFVTVSPESKITYNRFYRASAAYLCGWVDSASIEFVK
ncbi:MAG: hypothetical protein AB1690_07370 [Candidatus Zixiibacteriota bacterium]